MYYNARPTRDISGVRLLNFRGCSVRKHSLEPRTCIGWEGGKYLLLGRRLLLLNKAGDRLTQSAQSREKNISVILATSSGVYHLVPLLIQCVNSFVHMVKSWTQQSWWIVSRADRKASVLSLSRTQTIWINWSERLDLHWMISRYVRMPVLYILSLTRFLDRGKSSSASKSTRSN